MIDNDWAYVTGRDIKRTHRAKLDDKRQYEARLPLPKKVTLGESRDATACSA